MKTLIGSDIRQVDFMKMKTRTTHHRRLYKVSENSALFVFVVTRNKQKKDV